LIDDAQKRMQLVRREDVHIGGLDIAGEEDASSGAGVVQRRAVGFNVKPTHRERPQERGAVGAYWLRVD